MTIKTARAALAKIEDELLKVYALTKTLDGVLDTMPAEEVASGRYAEKYSLRMHLESELQGLEQQREEMVEVMTALGIAPETHVQQHDKPWCVAAACATACGSTLEAFRTIAGHEGRDGYSMKDATIFLAMHGHALGYGAELVRPVFDQTVETTVLRTSLPPALEQALSAAAERAGMVMSDYAVTVLQEHLGVDDTAPEVVGLVGTPGRDIQRNQDFWIKIPVDQPALLAVDGASGEQHMVFYDGRQVYDGTVSESLPLSSFTVKRWWPLFDLAPGGFIPRQGVSDEQA